MSKEERRRYGVFWKWMHRSASSPSLAHKTYGTTTRTVPKPARQKSRRNIMPRRVPSSPDLYRRGVEASDDAFLGALEAGVHSSEDLLEGQAGASGLLQTSPWRNRRAVSTSQLLKLRLSPDSPQDTPDTLTSARQSRSVSALPGAGSGDRAPPVPPPHSPKKIKKKRLSLSLGRLRVGDEGRSKKKGGKGSSESRVEGGGSPVVTPGSDTVDSQAPTHPRGYYFVAPDDAVASPTYDIMTPSELYERRSSLAKTTKVEEKRPRAGSARSPSDHQDPPLSPSDPSPLTSEVGQDQSGPPPAVGVPESSWGKGQAQPRPTTLPGLVGQQEEDQYDPMGGYSVPGPARFIYQAPPPPRKVIPDPASFPDPDPPSVSAPAPTNTGDEGQSGGEQGRAGQGEGHTPPQESLRSGPQQVTPDPAPQAPPAGTQDKSGGGAAPGDSSPTPRAPRESPSPAPPSSATSASPDQQGQEELRRTASDAQGTPRVLRKQQQVRRSSSAPSRPRSRQGSPYHPLQQTLSPPAASAMPPILSDHLAKHNLKVLHETGLDLVAAPAHSPVLRAGSDASSTFQPRPRLPHHSPVTRSSSAPPHRRGNKPAPPVRSPTTRLSTVGPLGAPPSSPSTASSGVSTPHVSPTALPAAPPSAPQQVLRRSSSLTSMVMVQNPDDGSFTPYTHTLTRTHTLAHTPGPALSTFKPVPRRPRQDAAPPQPLPQPRRWSLSLDEMTEYLEGPQPPPQQPPVVAKVARRHSPPARPRQPGQHDVARTAVTNWVAHRLAQQPHLRSMYMGQRWSRTRPGPYPGPYPGPRPNVRPGPIYLQGRIYYPTIHEELEEDLLHTLPPLHPHQTKSSSDSDHSVGGLRTASLDRLGRRSHGHPAAHAHAHTPHYTLPRRPQVIHRYSQPQAKGKGYGYSPPAAVFDEDPGIMSEAETSSTGFRRGGKPRASLLPSRTPSTKTLDSRNFEMEENSSYWDEDPGIMSEAETSSTGRGRNLKPRTSLPIVRTPSKTLERPLGLVFLQFRGETKRALLPNEITSLDTVKALFVRSFPNQLTMQYLDLPSVKIYIHDSSKDMFYHLEDMGDIRDRAVLRVFEGEGVNGQGGGAWDQDQSYFSEPEFESDFQQQHVHSKPKSGKSGGYYMTHSYPPGAPPPQPNSGLAPIPRGPRPTYTPERMHGDGYLSSPERSPRPYGGGGGGGPFLTPTPSYEDPYYPPQYPSRSGSVTPIIDEEARSAFYSMRVEQMERQLASLTGLVQKALNTGVATSPRPDQMSLAPPPAVVAAQAAAAAAAAAAVVTTQSSQDRDAATQSRPANDFLQVPTSTSYTKSSAEKQPMKPAIKCSTLPRMSSQDLRLSPEVYNQLRVLQKKAKELRTDVRNLRKTSQANALTMKDLLRDTVAKITTVLQSGEATWMQGSGDAERARLQREEASYRQDMNRLDKDLCDLELKVEELRNNVINRRLRVNMSDVENMALILSRSSKTVADLKAKFPILQDGLKGLISAEMERAICNEKFLKEEPDKLESALRRCKKLTGTLVTLKRLASVQEQRVPPGLLPGVLVANGDPRAPSPPPSEDPRAAAVKVCVEPLPRSASTRGRPPSHTRPISVNATSSPNNSTHTSPRPRSTSAHARFSSLSNRPHPAVPRNNMPISKSTKLMINSKPALSAKPNILTHTLNLRRYTSANSFSNSKAVGQTLDCTPEREVGVNSKPEKDVVSGKPHKTPILDPTFDKPSPDKSTTPVKSTPVVISEKATSRPPTPTFSSSSDSTTPTPPPPTTTRSRPLLSRKRTPTSL